MKRKTTSSVMRRMGTSLTFSEDMYSLVFVTCFKSELIYYHDICSEETEENNLLLQVYPNEATSEARKNHYK